MENKTIPRSPCCNFCGRALYQVQKLVRGRVGGFPSYICDGCVASDRWLSAPPTFAELCQLGIPPRAIVDIAIRHKGLIIIAFAIEIVHRNACAQEKLDFLELSGISVIEIPTRWILGQVGVPADIPDEFFLQWFDDDFRDFAIYMVFSMHQAMRPFVGSFSANGDLLSQWRAYSNDGRGFSLGLRASHIHKKWGVRLKKIEYRETRQETIIKQSLLELQDICERPAASLPRAMSTQTPTSFPT